MPGGQAEAEMAGARGQGWVQAEGKEPDYVLFL